jgi:hypothetical protein
VAKAAKHEQHVAVCVVKVLLLPGADTPDAVSAAAAAAAAAAGGGGGGKAKLQPKGSGKAAAAAGGGGGSASIRSFFKPAPKPAAAGAAGASKQQQHVVACEADLLAAGAEIHYLLVQRPDAGLLAGLWEFPGGRALGRLLLRRAACVQLSWTTLAASAGRLTCLAASCHPGVVIDCEPSPAARRTAVDAYLSTTLGVAGLQESSSKGPSPQLPAGVRLVHRRQLGSAVHIFSHIRQTMHAEECVLLAPSLGAVCPTAAAAASAAAAPAAAKEDQQQQEGADVTGSSKQKKRKASGSGGSSSSSAPPGMRWVSGADISKQGLTSGVRKVLQLSLK